MEKPYFSLPRATFFVWEKTMISISSSNAASHCKPRAPRAFLRVGGSVVLVVVVVVDERRPREGLHAGWA